MSNVRGQWRCADRCRKPQKRLRKKLGGCRDWGEGKAGLACFNCDEEYRPASRKMRQAVLSKGARDQRSRGWE
jgi:hypothetical protein